MYKAADHMKEGVRDLDPEKGTAERKARLEKKRGMKLDDHPQYKKEDVSLGKSSENSEIPEEMSPQEIQLQKKKATIDKMIAQRRKTELAKGNAPTKTMGEEVVSERTRFAKETGKDFKTGNPSEKGGTRTGKSAFDKVSRDMRKTGGVMSSRGKPIQPQGKKKQPGKKGYKGVTPVDKIRNRLAQKRVAKPNPYRACLLYTSPSPRDATLSRMPSSA